MILGACNPHLAHQALEAEPHIRLLLPCNVVVQEETDGTIAISIVDPRAMFKLVDNPAVAARIRLTEVLKKGGESMKNKLVTLTVFVAGMFLTSVGLAAFLGSPP